MNQEWDGMLSPPSHFSIFSSNDLGRTLKPILDREGRLVAILAGHPDDESWLDLSKQAADLLEEARGRCQIPAKASRHCRGHFTAL